MLNISCHSTNISEYRMEEKKKEVDQWNNLCEKLNSRYKYYLNVKAKYKNKKIPSELKIYLDTLESDFKKFSKFYSEEAAIEALDRDYEYMAKITNSINLIYYKILGDNKKIELYQFEKDWYLPGGKGSMFKTCGFNFWYDYR